ncbi:MAG TPA: phosphoenolpyruvate carboxykinase (ATP) [Sphingobacteriaceae bacterium]|nr:phosphoenolpyruvate carboxykinase (ATP) [Sphingobacteriaceae bacterium]
MEPIIVKNKHIDLSYLGLNPISINYQLNPQDLNNCILSMAEGVSSDTGAMVVDTGEFTGRAPKDRYIVNDNITQKAINWGDVNIPISTENYNKLYTKLIDYLNTKTVFAQDGFACAEEKYTTSIRVISQTAYQSLFAHNMFLRSEARLLRPEWTILAAPGLKADPESDGTRQHNFSVINFSDKIILIGGTGYTGEIKKAIFSVLNFLLPLQNVLPMHCSANVGKQGDTAIFFGLSGTGKTTLSADPERYLIGDDEHGWGEDSIFNFEGGCYAKTTGLSLENEPEIYSAIRAGALLENVKFYPGTSTVDYNNLEKTENTRVSYPINFITKAITPSIGKIPGNIFFLTADAFGVLPPISKLTRGQAMYHFLSGYTAKIAGTEFGINEPQATFSACFGKAFLPLHPVVYANLLGKKLENNNIKVWLINTGWTGGSYGSGTRIKLGYTRNMIQAALMGTLDNVNYSPHPVFNLMMPETCDGVPSSLLNPQNTWENKKLYNQTCIQLADLFTENFKQFIDIADEETRLSGPNINTVLV